VRSRFFGASSYDDEDDYDNEDEPMDMSGFIGSTTVEQPPIVVERKRASREAPPAPSTGDSGMGNAGPRSVPPPQPQMRNIGYAPSIVMNAANNSGSPFNPLWAHDETLGPSWLPVVSKTTGLALITSSVLVARGLDWGPRTKMMLATGAFMYAHPVLGLSHGLINQYMGNTKWRYVPMVGQFLLPGAVVYRKIKK
jgi:hypothetical protein